MLLKQQRSGSKKKFSNPYSVKHKAAMETRAQQLVNVYVPKEKRLEKKNENQRAHFNLGGNEKMPMLSYGQDLIAKSSQQNLNSNNGEDQVQRLKMIDNARKDNFSIGESGVTNSRLNRNIQSSSRDAFDPMTLSKAHLNQGRNDCLQNAIDFKHANFQFGTTDLNYQTTNKEIYFNKGVVKRDNVTNAQVQKQKQPNFDYGKVSPDYVSTTKNSYVQHETRDLSGQRKEQKQKALDFRQAQFYLGTDQQTFKPSISKYRSPTPQGLESNKKLQKLVPYDGEYSNLAGRRTQMQTTTNKNSTNYGATNFSVGHKQFQQPNQFVSLNMAQMQQVQNENGEYKNVQQDPEVVHERLKDVRRAHFNFGNNQTSYISQAGSMIQHPITVADIRNSETHMESQKDRMRKANFSIPYTSDRNTELSTYKQCISNLVQEDALNPGKAQLMSNLKKASIKIGTNPQGNDYTTEQKNQYIPLNHNSHERKDHKQEIKMKQNLKGHHFELGYGHTGHSQHMNPMSQFHKGKRTQPNSVQSSINATAENYAHNYTLGYDQSKPKLEMKNKGIDNYIHKHVKPLQLTSIPYKPKAVPNGQISAKNNNWGF